MKVLTIFAPGKIAGAEKVVSVGTNAINRSSKIIFPSMIIIEEKKAPDYAKEFIKTIENKETISRIKCNTPLDFKMLTKLKKEISKVSPIIVHTHGHKALFYAYLSKILLRSPIKLIHTHHGNTDHTLKVKLYEYLAHIIMKKCDKVISVSPKMTLEFKEKGFKNITEVNNMFSLSPAKSSTKNHKLFPPSVTHFLYLGRFSHEKNPKTLLKAFCNLLGEQKNTKLHMVGDGPLLERLKNEYGHHKEIEFYGHKKDIREFINNSNYLCLPSLTEGMPMTLIESLCLGTPIVANNVGAIPFMVDNNNCILIDLDKHKIKKGVINFDSLTNHWLESLRLAINTDKKSYTQKNKEIEKEKYSLVNWVKKIEREYQKLASSI